MSKAVIFDFDGTLVDTIGSIWTEYQRVIKKLSLKPITHRDFTRHVGRAWDDIILTFWPDLDPKEFTKHYRISAEQVKLFPGVDNALEIMSKDHTLAIMTSRGHTINRHLLTAGLNKRLFARIYNREMLNFNKPDPRALLQVCIELKLKPSNTIYVGDSIIDAQCALGAGVGFVAVLSGGAYQEDFKEIGISQIIPSVADLPSILDKI
jgi:phosphoglycolate phosphatase